MAGLVDHMENKILDHIFGGGDYTRETTLHIALSTTTPTDAGGNITEPVGNNYSRVSFTNNATNFPAASSGAKANGTAITFPTASGSWGVVTHVVIYNHASGTATTNVVAWGALTASKTIDTSDTASFAINDLDITLD